MKIYVVTEGHYSDYHIEQVFTDKKRARAYANLYPERHLETYVADRVSVKYEKQEKHGLYVAYDFKNNKIDSYSFGELEGIPDSVDSSWAHPIFRFEVEASERLYYDIAEHHGYKSPLLLKIAQDRFASYCYENFKNADEILREKEAEKERWMLAHTPLWMASSSSVSAANTINADINRILKQKIENEEPLPDAGKLTKMIFDMKNNVDK